MADMNPVIVSQNARLETSKEYRSCRQEGEGAEGEREGVRRGRGGRRGGKGRRGGEGGEEEEGKELGEGGRGVGGRKKDQERGEEEGGGRGGRRVKGWSHKSGMRRWYLIFG